VQLHFYAIYTLGVRSVHHDKKQHKLSVIAKLRYTQLIYFVQAVTFLVANAFRLLCADIFVFLLVASHWPNAHQLAFLIYVIVTFFVFFFSFLKMLVCINVNSCSKWQFYRGPG